MLGKLSHVAIVVPDLDVAVAQYRDALGAEVSSPRELPEFGMTSVAVQLPNARLELLCPLGEDSPIENFLFTHRDGGIHHICYEVADVFAARDKLVAGGARVLGGEPAQGARGRLGIFLHPKDFSGTLIKLEQAG